MSILMGMTICPPLWKWAINPRAKAANNFNAGKINKEVSFNYIQAKTPHDIFTDRVVYAYSFCWMLFFGYLALFSDLVLVKPYLAETNGAFI